jgi:hypothetical protein
VGVMNEINVNECIPYAYCELSANAIFEQFM